MPVLEPYFGSKTLAGQIGLSQTVVRTLFDNGVFGGYCIEEKKNAKRFVERRSVVRFLRSRGSTPLEIPRPLICRVGLFGLTEPAERNLRRLLPDEDFVISDADYPDMMVVDLNRADLDDSIRIMNDHAVKYSVAVIPDDGISAKLKNAGFDHLVKPPARWPVVAAILRKYV